LARNECLSTPFRFALRGFRDRSAEGRSGQHQAQRDDRSRAARPVSRGSGFFVCSQSSSRRPTLAFVRPHALVKEPTENQANRHFQT